MNSKLFHAGLMFSLLSGQAAMAQSIGTQWVPIDKSMTTMLNEGWRIVSHSNAQTQYDISFVNSFTFVLTRENKVAICLIDSPEPNNAESRCRALN